MLISTGVGVALLLLCLAVPSCYGVDITEYGAIAQDSTTEACWANSKAITKAILAANASEDSNVVTVPANNTFYYFYVELWEIYNVTIQIDGVLAVTNNITQWPAQVNHTLASFFFASSSFITFQGTGLIDGQGYDWWWYVILTSIDHRPHLITMAQCSDIKIQGGLHLRNSPMYHILLEDVRNVFIEDIDIYVNVTDQHALLRDHGLLDERGIPIFPLNTDGIDPSGINVLIQNVRIENFDDAVAVKPQNGASYFSNCSENMVIRDSHVNLGVGMTIGSVPPHVDTNCVRNITFQNITFQDPFKAIYVKTNPGTEGNGLIENIIYKDITASGSVWYPLWIGPQQQRQPGTVGTGCSFFFPTIDECPTQPRVTVRNIILDNVVFVNGHDLPGVLLCNETNPCTGFQFINVKNSGPFDIQDTYYCEYVEGITSNSNPAPSCLSTGTN